MAERDKNTRPTAHVKSAEVLLGLGGRGVRPTQPSLAAPARAAAAHALIATAGADHDGAADVAAGCVSHVDHSGSRGADLP
jgi:hypothetical protein